MTFPQVQVNQIDLAQSAPNEIERHLLFISYAPPENYEPGFYTLNTQTDLDKINSLAGDDIRAAMMNAGQNWSAAVYFMDSDEKWQDVVKDCQKYGSFEGIVLLEDFAGWNEDESGFSLTKSAKEAAALRQELIAKHGRWTWFILPVKNPAGGDMTWQQYSAALTQWQTGLVADGVMLVPRLYENLPGVIAGRLCNRLVTIADTPARVLTGSLVYVGNATKDKNGETVTADIVRALDAARYSVPVTYADFEGIYWNDGPLLAAKGSDYQSIRILRIVDKVARQVRLLAIRNIGNRSLNSTPASMEYNKMVFAKPLRTMAKSSTINGVSFPGEVYSPKEGDVVITWIDSTHVNIYVQVRPTECPLVIVVNVMVDLSVQNEA
ncbi:DUF2586 domain-containing protein [Escherichia coli]|uniref:DUF2586 domain-containing protein n=1 Tax=Escherichia coli TaxID=562 RepID=UPI0005305BB8|nr:DUF2586 domain-containing protein [Escherichia coli]EFN7277932.1 DUF2586 family protein [Escherichia coli O11:H5]EEZ6654342.1 DUF2586 family protein [Escherichia coli]EFN9924988.1 DUF2586 family protein [Escherichia coli]EGB1671350.1 DUF2586 family protein [Escherichia coli]EHM2956310.1 DUF2586 family protein [Escherichia coli]